MSVNTTNPQNISVNTILQKLGISELNEMQEEASLAISSAEEVIILSPTGTGKTLAFLLPEESTLEIDEIIDFDWAEFLVKYNKVDLKKIFKFVKFINIPNKTTIARIVNVGYDDNFKLISVLFNGI